MASVSLSLFITLDVAGLRGQVNVQRSSVGTY
jgi:hypothetical protein